MANQKQDGSNLINVEYSTGRCLTQCEQCFVNYGQQGTATCLGTFNPGHEPLLDWIEDVEGPKTGYVAASPPSADLKVPRGYEPLLRKVTKTGKGLWNIPAQAAQARWVLDPQKARKRMHSVIKGLEDAGEFPFFLRVSSMSDSSRAPVEWLRKVYDVWGDQCFFNSAIRSVKWAVEHGHRDRLDVYHKLVVTMNPGKQTLPEFYPRAVRAVSSKQRTRDRNKWSKLKGATPLNSMGRVVDRERDFLHPQTLTDIGLGSYEDVIKFYRQRALATIQGFVETDRPIVITQMRFVSPAHAAEFARRYQLELELHIPGRLFQKGGDVKPSAGLGTFLDIMRAYDGIKLIRDNKSDARMIRLRTKKGDKRNVSPLAGEWTEMLWLKSYYRVSGVAFGHEDYVCDRLHGSCKRCGLCATLDGTGPTIQGVPFCNELNVAPWGDVILPLPGLDGAAYLGDLDGAGGDFFRELLNQTQSHGDFEANPGEIEPASQDDCVALLRNGAAYLDKGQEYDLDFCESWDTHEDATEAVAFAVWSLVAHAQAAGESMDDVYDFIDETTGDLGVDVLDGVSELDTIWTGESCWCDQFGPTR